nr:transposase (putative), gypsy type [Tanacetum cinerariifolium]
FPVIHQLIREKMCAELLAEEQEANIDTQSFQYSVVPQPPQEEMSVEFFQEKRNQINSVKTFLRKFNRISFYEMLKVLSLAWETILEIELAFEDKHCQSEDILELFRRLHNDVQNIHEELAVYINTPNWDRPTIYYDNDDEDYAIAVTPSLSTEEPNNSLTTESDEVIKSSVEDLVPIPSDFKDITIDKGMQNGLEAGIDHGRAGRSLADVAAYDPFAKANYVSAVHALRGLDFPLLSQLESQKDAIIADIMSLFNLEGSAAETLEASQLQTSIKGEAASHHLSLSDAMVPLIEPLSAGNLVGEASTSGVPTGVAVTFALSTTFAQTGSVPPMPVSAHDAERNYI